MTHYELLTQNEKEASATLCRHTDCEKCFAAEWCSPGHNGLTHWLEMKDSEDDE